jgi:predicted PurR-regulated permease PerM
MVASSSRTHLVAFLGLLVGSLVVIFWMIGPYLLALFLGGILAMLTFPIYKWLLLKRWGPRMSALGVTVFILLLVIIPVTWFSIMAVQQGILLAQSLPDLTAFSPQTLTRVISRWSVVKTMVGDAGHVGIQLKSGIFTLGEYLTGGILTLAKGIPAFILQIALAMIACFFFLTDGKRLVTWLLGMSPLHPAVQEKLVDTFRTTAFSTILSSLFASSCQAALAAFGFLILGVPGAFLAGGATFILSWLPVMGSVPVWLVGIVYLYCQGSIIKLCMMVALAVATGIIENVIRALMLRGKAAMHPLVGLVAVFGGINMFGILGVFIGPILAALFISLLKLWPELRERFRLE